MSSTQIRFANKAIANKRWVSGGVSPIFVAVSNQAFIFTDNDQTPSFYYSIDETGYMNNYTLNNIPLFSSNNPNPDMTSSPITLSGAVSILVSIAALILAGLLMWAQDKVLERRKREWIDDADVPGSKVAEEVDEEAFRAYQREQHERMQCHIQEQPRYEQQHQQPDNYYPYADVTVSPAFETIFTSRSATTSRDALNEMHSGPLRADGLEQLAFSSHPRPNVVTTITDDVATSA